MFVCVWLGSIYEVNSIRRRAYCRNCWGLFRTPEWHTSGSWSRMWTLLRLFDRTASQYTRLKYRTFKFFYRIENWCFSVELTIIFMNDLEIFYRCLSDTYMKVEHVRLGLFVPDWRFVAQLDQIGHVFALPLLDYRAVIL